MPFFIPLLNDKRNFPLVAHSTSAMLLSLLNIKEMNHIFMRDISLMQIFLEASSGFVFFIFLNVLFLHGNWVCCSRLIERLTEFTRYWMLIFPLFM